MYLSLLPKLKFAQHNGQDNDLTPPCAIFADMVPLYKHKIISEMSAVQLARVINSKWNCGHCTSLQAIGFAT